MVGGVALIEGESTAAGEFRYDAVCVPVDDGELIVEIGGLSGATVLDLIGIAGTECEPAP